MSRAWRRAPSKGMRPASWSDGTDHVRAHRRANGTGAEPASQQVGGRLRGLLQPRGISRLDLMPQGRALAVARGRVPRRRRLARVLACLYADRGEPGKLQLLLDLCSIVIAMRYAGQEQRWVV